MSDIPELSPLENTQSPGIESKTKRNSGLFSFFKWFKPSSSRESLNSSSVTSSSESLSSLHSTGTVASFSYIDPNAYPINVKEKTVQQRTETETYKKRLLQRDKRRENDKNLTLRKKYNLFFNRETLLKITSRNAEENTKSLPLMTRTTNNEPEEAEERLHRRTNSESSKIKKAGAYLHVKGKRKAPQPPKKNDETSTLSLRRKNKRTAPPPPQETKISDVIHDTLKLDHGILKPTKQPEKLLPSVEIQENIYATCSPILNKNEDNVSPKPWYKRNTKEGTVNAKKDFLHSKNDKYGKLPEVPYNRNSIIDIQEEDKKKEDKRKSNITQLPNISELDREAAEILKKEKIKNIYEMPEFMKPKDIKINNETLTAPKKRSAKDLIAKFNAITSVTKVTVFGARDTKKDYFGKVERKHQEALLESHKKRLEMIDKKLNPKPSQPAPLMKSESVSVVKKPETPKADRKSWSCPKCYVNNEYWRIICHVCSAIKPYFDDWTTSPSPKRAFLKENNPPKQGILERSKTQIGFSALSNYNTKKIDKNEFGEKNDEREKLKKMLIEMKNSLPKRKNNLKQNANRTSIIDENPEFQNQETKEEKSEIKHPEKKIKLEKNEPIKANDVLEILVGTKTTIYENIKVKNEDSKPSKVSSAVQTSFLLHNKKENVNITDMVKKKNSFELMKPKDFEDIYGEKNGKNSPRNIYANLARNDELSLFFNMPKNLTELKNTLGKMKLQKNTNTIEINRMLRKLEVAIARGETMEAANFAKELAELKVNCSVVRQKSEESGDEKENIIVDMYVEDKVSHRGPFPLQVKEKQTVGELKMQVEKEFAIPTNVQRWILGKDLALDDKISLQESRITHGCAIFLYLVAPDNKLIDDLQLKPSTSSNTSFESTIKIEDIIAKEKQKNDVPTSSGSSNPSPKIINVVPKLQKGLSSDSESQSVIKSANDKKDKSNKHNFNEVVTQTVTTVLYAPKEEKKLKEDEDNDYDVKTLKPTKEWECHLCTLLNPISTRVCQVCATVRLQAPERIPRKTSEDKHEPTVPTITKDQTYLQLVDLDNTDLVHNVEPFDCLICFLEVPANEGITLRECLHQFCKDCLRHTIEFNEEVQVKCPYRDQQYSCNLPLQDREIKHLVSKEMYDQYLAKAIIQAENKIDKSFHCKTPDCKGWCIFEDNVNEFKCPVCRRVNCLTCQAIHMGINCKQYQERMNEEAETDENAKRTKEMLQEMVNKGEALNCPTCQVVMMKKWGCDWLRCSMCKTEICWVTRGPRWGPDGKGDTSGGCKCGVNGVKCHPKCSYCH